MKNNKEKCFVIMPISTPEHVADDYKDDNDHFSHVLEHLFIPAINNAGFEPIPPKSTGSEIIQAEIIKHLSTAEMVLCDMSILNPNVFFEFGIRTALNKPVSLVVDDKTTEIPFDTSIINFYQYDSSLDVWNIEDEINALSEHLRNTFDKDQNFNSLWKFFGVSQTGIFKPEESTIGDKIDLIMTEIDSLKRKPSRELVAHLSKTAGASLPTASNAAPGSLAEVEKNAIVKTLLHTGGNKSQAARELGISRSTLREKLKLYEINI